MDALEQRRSPRFMTPAEVAEEFGLSESWQAKARMLGTFAAFHKLGPKKVRYDRADLLDWFEAQRRTSTRPCAKAAAAK